MIKHQLQLKKDQIQNEYCQETPKKATEESFNELHYLVTEDFLRRIRSGEATTQDLKAACDWLKTNDITGVAYEGSPLDKLNKLLPTVDDVTRKEESLWQKLLNTTKKNPKARKKRLKQQAKYNKTRKVYHLESMQTNLIENLELMATVTEWMPPIIRVVKPKAEHKSHLLTEEADLKLKNDPITT